MKRPASRPSVVSKIQPGTAALLLAALTVPPMLAAAPKASAVTFLDPLHNAFSLVNGSQDIATSVGSLFFSTASDELTEGGFERSGQASAVLIDVGSAGTWVLTAGHNLAPVGQVEVEDGVFISAEVDLGLDPFFNTSETIPVDEWFVFNGAPDNAGVIGAGDIALFQIPFDDAELAQRGASTVPIFTRDTPEEFIADVFGQDVDLVGFGLSGDITTGGTDTTLLRRQVSNRIEPFLDSPSRVSIAANDNFLQVDVDINREDELYDLTPDDFTDLNPFFESFYALKNIGEIVVSGSEEVRQVPEEDFRIPFEGGLAPGDSGGGVFLGDALLGIPISVRAVGVDTDGDGDEDDAATVSIGSVGSQAQIISLNDLVPFINNLVFFAEQAEIDFLNGLRASPDLGPQELLSLGFSVGGVDLDPVFPFPDSGDGSTTLGTSTNDYIKTLEVSYHFGEALTLVQKAQLVGALSATASTTLSDEELLELIDNPNLTTVEELTDALNADLTTIYGAPTFDRAIAANKAFRGVLSNNTVNERGVTSPEAYRNAAGDLDGDGDFDADDVDALAQGIEDGAAWADLDGNGTTDDLDTGVFVEGLLGLLMGDANLDGRIDQSDLNAVLLNWGDSEAGWAEGNFGGEEFVGQFDLNAVLNNWGATSAPNFEGFAVPEPAALTLLGLGGLAVLRRRGA